MHFLTLFHVDNIDANHPRRNDRLWCPPKPVFIIEKDLAWSGFESGPYADAFTFALPTASISIDFQNDIDWENYQNA